MFEKEAEEYADKKICQEYIDGCMGFYKCKENCERYHNTQKYWQDGANFGYNKSNEWNFTHRNKEHLVVDCPKGEENKLYLLLLNSRDSKEYEFGRKVPVVCYWDEEWSRFERLEHTIGERTVNQNDINAWKEIVLGEVSE